MITSQTLAVLGSLVVLLPVAFTALPSGFNPHSAGQRDDAWHSGSEIDHHQIVDASLAPYSAIGKFKGTMTCTAAIVLNPRIIITAGHCVTERDGTTRKSNFSFHLAYQAGADLGPFQATVWAVGSKQSLTHESVRDASRDWAILVLNRAPTDVQPLLLSHRSLRTEELSERQILLPAYSNDIGNAEVLSVDPVCSVRDLVWDTLLHTCVARPGSSGAPLLLRDGSGYALIGIHTASIFASDADGHVGKFVGNQAVASWMFSDAAFTLSRQLDNGPVQTVNSGNY